MSAATRRAALGALMALPLATAAPAAPTSEIEAYRRRLLTAFTEERAKAPIDNCAAQGSVEADACARVSKRLWGLCEEICALPPPRTMAGLGLLAQAVAILWECETADYPDKAGAIALVRATLAFTETAMPPAFCGFGDEPAAIERSWAMWEAEGGSLPAWAIAEAEAALCA